MAKKLIVPGHPEYEPLEFDKLAKLFERSTPESAKEAVADSVRKTVQWLDDRYFEEYFLEREPATAESAHLKPYDGVLQDDGWDNDCC